MGGFGDGVLDALNRAGVHVPLLKIALAEGFVHHGAVDDLRRQQRIDADGILDQIREALGLPRKRRSRRCGGHRRSLSGSAARAVGDQRERMLRGDLYRANDPELVEARNRGAAVLSRLTASGNADSDARNRLLAELVGPSGRDSTVLVPFHCDYGAQISIGDRSFVNAGATFLDCASVSIGDDVQIGPAVQLLTATHPLDAAERASGLELARPIVIGSGAWLGGGVIVGPGVTIGERTVVGAGSVVIRDLPADVLAVGNPARIVRSL